MKIPEENLSKSIRCENCKYKVDVCKEGISFDWFYPACIKNDNLWIEDVEDIDCFILQNK